jgi:hypothetical protein
VIIGDDSDQPGQRLNLDVALPVLYLSLPRCTIGQKRNILKGRAQGDILVHMDTDDSYSPTYIESLVRTLSSHKRVQVTGSSDMLFINPLTNWSGNQSCIYLNQLNEATMGYTKEYATKHNYADRSHSENETFINDVSLIRETHISDIMVCTIHDSNTVDKSPWQADQFKGKLPRWFWKGSYYRILKDIYK